MSPHLRSSRPCSIIPLRRLQCPAPVCQRHCGPRRSAKQTHSPAIWAKQQQRPRLQSEWWTVVQQEQQQQEDITGRSSCCNLLQLLLLRRLQQSREILQTEASARRLWRIIVQGAAFKAVVCQPTTSIGSACLHQWVPLLALGHSSKRSNLIQYFLQHRTPVTGTLKLSTEQCKVCQMSLHNQSMHAVNNQLSAGSVC